MKRSLVLVVTLLSCILSAPWSIANEPAGVVISRDVVVQQGDTLSSIARRELGRAGLAAQLANYNSVGLNDTLNAGDVIRIPIRVPSDEITAQVVFAKGDVSFTRLLNPVTSRANQTAVTGAIQTSDSSTAARTESQPLRRYAAVLVGDTITTASDGFASIAFSSGSVINLQPNTIASFDHIACLESDDNCLVEIMTQQGRVTFDIEGRSQQTLEFIVTTPYASAAVRGTVFDIDLTDNFAVSVSVTEGDVDVAAQAETVAVPEGFGVVVKEGESPGGLIELLPAPVFKRVPARFALGDTVEWWGLSSADAYRVVLSNDEAAAQSIADFELSAQPSVFDIQQALTGAVSSGNYFLTLGAVDDNGLAGYKSNTRITLADVDTDIDPVSTSVRREGSEFVVAIEDLSDLALGYEIQIASDDDFSDPLSVDVNETGTAVFRVDEDRVFTRARVLVNPFTVSAFGPVTSN